MTRQEYNEWRKADPSSKTARLLKGTRDPIVILGIPTGREGDGYIEGFVVQSDSIEFPVNYASAGWMCEAFEFVEGSLTFTTEPREEQPQPAWDPADHEEYTIEQFQAATKDLVPILAGLGFPPLEIINVIHCTGVQPKGTTRISVENGAISVTVELQDDGREPYAVVGIKRFGRPAGVDWHAASHVVEVGGLYPFQFDAIPDVVVYLKRQSKVPELPLIKGTTKGETT